MRINKKQLVEAAEPIENNYNSMVDELMIILSEYLGKDVDEYTLAKKYSQLGEITDESIRIISKYTKKSINEVEDIFRNISNMALSDVEPMYQEAVNKGVLSDVGDLSDSLLINSLINEISEQTRLKIQNIQPVVLNSVVEMYQNQVNRVIQDKTIHLERLVHEQKVSVPEFAQKLIDQAINDVVVEREITHIAISKAVDSMVEDGLTGFVDSAGRHWQPDTYSSMVVRTNAHNVAIDSIMRRQEEYGSDIFQVSSHPGARPLCYPYQGKLLSWTSKGSFVDGAGVRWDYDNIENTSYGEPAGLFGINCGHYPLPIIPNVSIVHDQPVQDEEENNKEYQESQKQRYLERKIREDKRNYEMQRISGADEETLKRYQQKIYDSQKDMREFISETGRTRRYEREQIPNPKKPKVVKGKPEVKPVEVKTEIPKNNYDVNDLSGVTGKLDKNAYNDSREIIADYINKYPELKDKISVVGSYQERNKAFRKELYPEYLKELKRMNPNISDVRLEAFAKRSVNRVVGNISQNTYAAACYAGSSKNDSITDIYKKYSGIVLNEKQLGNLKTFNEKFLNDIKSGWHPIATNTNYLKQLIDHEIGHQLDNLIDFRNDKEFVSYFVTLTEKDIKNGLSQYPVSKRGLNFRKAELIAEAWSEYQNNDNPREIARIVGEMLERKLENR